MVKDCNKSNLKVLYKKIDKNVKVNRIEVEFFTENQGNLKEKIEENIERNPKRVLKSVISEEIKGEKVYFLAFETKECSADSVVVQMSNEIGDETIFVSDVTKKMTDFASEVLF